MSSGPGSELAGYRRAVESVDKLCLRVNAQLAEDRLEMVSHRVLAHLEQFGDRHHAVALQEMGYNIAFPSRKQIHVRMYCLCLGHAAAGRQANAPKFVRDASHRVIEFTTTRILDHASLFGRWTKDP